MCKTFILPLFFCVFLTSGVRAQEFDKKKKEEKKEEGRKKSYNERAVAYLIVKGNHDFYLSVDDKKPGDKIVRNNGEKISLTVGKVHKLMLEEADSTGETLLRFVRVTPDMVRRNDSVLTVAFNNDYLDIIQPNATSGTLRTEGSNTALQEQEAKEKNIALELAKDMVLKPGGSFKTTDKGGGKERALQTVTVPSMHVGRHEVTQRQWQAVMGSNNSANKGCPDCPVENVSWSEAVSFIDKLNKAGVQRFRLPTETEWEYVAKKSIEEQEGSSIDPEEARLKLQDVIKKSAWYNEKTTQPVGRKKDIAGVFDLLGNVAEWCAGDGEKKVTRGGSYKDKEEGLRPSFRDSAPADRQKTVGFRLVADAD